MIKKNLKSKSLNEATRIYFSYRNEDSKEQVLQRAEGLIRYFARLYGGGCCEDDLFQVGSLGLLKALDNYDPARETGFVTYASHCIIGEIRHMVRKEVSFYRPGCIVKLQYKVDRIIEEYTKASGDVPTARYIADKLKVSEESVAEVMKAGFVRFEEIDAVKLKSTDYESFRLPLEDKLILYQAMRKLSDFQQKVMHLLFFMDMTQQQVANKLGITQKQVSRVKEHSIEQMRMNMKD
ncbi:MAG TPA: sigma-70 family RNA polymerase sigma factor [Desulfitobacteriaceae bacterium]|nr:sigma-70 family RNA polymerase sigma factor [Desulfitobacteriaceae bacterium]